MVKHHAKRAFLSHLIPVISVIVGAIVGISTIFIDPSLSLFAIGLIVIVMVIDFIILVWNIVQGVKVFVTE